MSKKIRAAREQHASMLALASQLRMLGCWDTAAAVSEDAAAVQAGIAQLEAVTAAGTEALMTTKPGEPEGFRLAPAAVLGVAVNVFPALDDAAITQRVLECAVAHGVSDRAARRFADQAAGVIRGFEFELCPSCGKDLDEHEVRSDAFGNAYAHCLAPEDPS